MTDTDQAAGTDEPRTEQATSRRVPWPVAGVLVLALLAASGVALWQAQRASDAHGDIDRRADAARTASDFTLALLSYDFDDLDAQRQAIAELATGDFADEFSEAMEAGLAASIEELQARATASVTDVMVSEVPGDRARAVVVADSEITSEAGERASTDTYLDVSMVFLDGRWQVDDVRTVATDAPPVDPSAAPGAGPTGEGDGGTGEDGG